MTYSDARYRAALRRARRRYRYGRRAPAWVWVAGGAAALAVLMGAPKAAHVLRDITGKPPATAVAEPGRQALDAVAYARRQIGCPYVWAAAGPCSAGYDCSGLVTAAYASAGVTIPRTTFAEWSGLHHVRPGHEQPGDLVLIVGSDGTWTNPGHVGIVTSPARHQMIEAWGSGVPVRRSGYGPAAPPGSGDQNVVGFARPVPLAHHVPTMAAAGSYTPPSWARALLRDGGYPVTLCTVGAVIAWQAAEGDWRAGHVGWHNLLNDKRKEPGSVNATTQGVQKYTSWAQGLEATLATLRGPDYGGIRAALAAGNDAQAVADAVSASPWGTRPFQATC